MSVEYLKQLLSELKQHGCCGVKISFEDEGALLNEITTMRYLTASVGLELSVKIGGCEAKRDIVDVTNLCADYIVAPMVESSFSLKKFVDSLAQSKFSNKRGINIETKLSVENIEDISKHFKKIDFITFGRVDFVGSLEQPRNRVDSEEVFEHVKNVFTVAKKHNVQCYMGGSISSKSKKFIADLIIRIFLTSLRHDTCCLIQLNSTWKTTMKSYVRQTYLKSNGSTISALDTQN